MVVSKDAMTAIGWIGLAASFHFAAYEFARGSTIVLYTTRFGSVAMSYALTILPAVSVGLIMIYNYILDAVGPGATLLWTTLLISLIFGVTALYVDVFTSEEAGGAIAIMYLTRQAYVSFLSSQFWSFLGSTVSEGDASKIFGPLVGATSLISSLAAYAVSSVSSYTSPMQQLYICSALLICSAVCGQIAYKLQASKFTHLASSSDKNANATKICREETEKKDSTNKKGADVASTRTKNGPTLMKLSPSTKCLVESQMMMPSSPTSAAMRSSEGQSSPGKGKGKGKDSTSSAKSSTRSETMMEAEAETVEMASEDTNANVDGGKSSSKPASSEKKKKKAGLDLSGGWKSMSLSPILPPLFMCTLCMQAVATLFALAFNSMLKVEITDNGERTSKIGNFYMITNGVSAVVQFLGLRQTFKRIPVGNVIIAMPCVISVLCTAAIFNFSLATVATCFMAFKILEYSVYVVSKELIFVPLSEYIDVVAYRLGKGGMNTILSLLQLFILESSLTPYQLQSLGFAVSITWFTSAFLLRQELFRLTSEKDSRPKGK